LDSALGATSGCGQSEAAPRAVYRQRRISRPKPGAVLADQLTNPYASLTRRSGHADTVEDMRFLVVAFGWLTLIVLVVPQHV
jgi:hypothetical protein